MDDAIEFHRKHKGKFAIASKVPLKNKEDLSLAYTPGVAKVSMAVSKDNSLAYSLTSKGNMVAVVSDGTAVLGLGDIGPYGAMPVMEGKAILFKHFGNIDAVPICLNTKDVDKIVETVKMIAPTFGGINLEDISAPRCFEVEERLKRELDIPVFHDDQHGTAIVVVAAIINALKIVKKDINDVTVVISGAGAAGIATAKLLGVAGVEKLFLVDSKGITSRSRTDLNKYKKELSDKFNMEKQGSLKDALKDADIFIGVSVAGALKQDMIKGMARDPIIIAMANPVPEIMPDEAYAAGAAIVATGRSDFPNQVNNLLAFPGIFRGAFDCGAKQITEEMKIASAHALAALIKHPTKDKILPTPFDEGVVEAVSTAVKLVHKIF